VVTDIDAGELVDELGQRGADPTYTHDGASLLALSTGAADDRDHEPMRSFAGWDGLLRVRVDWVVCAWLYRTPAR